jgi:hypothetical protein
MDGWTNGWMGEWMVGGNENTFRLIGEEVLRLTQFVFLLPTFYNSLNL